MVKLDGIIRFRKWELDEKRRSLAVLLDQRAECVAQLEQLDAEMVAQQSMARSDFGSVTMGAYIEAAREKRAGILDNIRKRDQEIEEKQDAVSDAFRELKTFEIADGRQKERFRKDMDRIEQNELDDQGRRAFENADI